MAPGPLSLVVTAQRIAALFPGRPWRTQALRSYQPLRVDGDAGALGQDELLWCVEGMPRAGCTPLSPTFAHDPSSAAEKKVGEYSKSKVGVTAEQNAFGLDADF